MAARRAAILLAVAAVSALPYAGSLGVPPLHDAPATIFRNPVVLEEPLSKIATADFWGLAADSAHGTRSYRPLATLTYAAEARLLGTAPWHFHAVDLTLQALAAVLLLLLLETAGLPSAFAIAAALLFAANPARSESVVKFVGRADLLALVLLFAALLAHLRARRAARPGAWEAATLVALAGALLSKEYAVAFPFVLVALDLAKPGARRPWRVGLGALGLVAVYLALRVALMGSIGGMSDLTAADNPLVGRSLGERYGTALALFAFAVRLLAFPHPLCHLYAPGTLAPASGLLDPRALLGVLLLAGLAALAVVAARRWRDPLPALGAALLAFPLAPALNTAGLAGVMFSELWLGPGAAGLALLVAWAASRLAHGTTARRLALGILGAAILAYAGLAAARVSAWKSGESLARAGLAAYPDTPKLWTELGIALGDDGKDREAAEAFEKAIALEPGDPRPRRNLAIAFTRLGEPAKAAAALRELIGMAPRDSALLWKELAEAESSAGRAGEAADAMRRARDLAPGDEAIRKRLPELLHAAALAAESRGRLDVAVNRYREILALEPDQVPTLFNLGRVLYTGGKPGEAIAPLERGLALREDPRARALLEEARRRSGSSR